MADKGDPGVGHALRADGSQPDRPSDRIAEASLRLRVRRLIDAFNGPFGKIVAGLIAEGQREPLILQQFFERWVSPRRTATIAELQRAKNAGELRSEAEPELLIDAIFGAIYYRLLEAYRERLLPFMPGQTREEKLAKIRLLFSSMAGVLMMARVIPTPEKRELILMEARNFFIKCFAEK